MRTVRLADPAPLMDEGSFAEQRRGKERPVEAVPVFSRYALLEADGGHAMSLPLEQLPPVRAQLAVRPDVPVDGLAGDAEFGAESPHLGVPFAITAIARRSFAGVILKGAPPCHSRARA